MEESKRLFGVLEAELSDGRDWIVRLCHFCLPVCHAVPDMC